MKNGVPIYLLIYRYGIVCMCIYRIVNGTIKNNTNESSSNGFGYMYRMFVFTRRRFHRRTIELASSQQFKIISHSSQLLNGFAYCVRDAINISGHSVQMTVNKRFYRPGLKQTSEET